MAVRQTGWALLASASVQEAQDMALIAHAATLEARLPFIHFFDGFRTSHEVNRFELVSEEDLRAMIDDDLVRKHRARGLNPDRPVMRGTAQNPDVYFQGREAGAGCGRRATVPGRRDRVERESGRGPRRLCHTAAGNRRPIRTLVERVHAGHGSGGV